MHTTNKESNTSNLPLCLCFTSFLLAPISFIASECSGNQSLRLLLRKGLLKKKIKCSDQCRSRLSRCLRGFCSCLLVGMVHFWASELVPVWIIYEVKVPLWDAIQHASNILFTTCLCMFEHVMLKIWDPATGHAATRLKPHSIFEEPLSSHTVGLRSSDEWCLRYPDTYMW